MASAMNRPAPRNPVQAITRLLLVNPARRANHAEIEPQNKEPSPPKNSGSTASCAACDLSSFQYCWRYVGSHVILKYHGNDRQPYCSHSRSTDGDVSSFFHGTRPWPDASRSDPSSSASSAAFTLGWSRGLSRYQR